MKLVPLVLLTSAALVSAEVAHAQERRDKEAPRRVEITPHVSIGSNASSGIGATVRWPVASKLSIELETALRESEVTGLLTNVSLIYDLPSIGRVTPYVAGGVGLEQYGTVFESPLGLITQKQTTFTVNAGGGIRVPIDDKWGVRTDARWSNGIGRQAPERWRVYNGVTFGTGGR